MLQTGFGFSEGDAIQRTQQHDHLLLTSGRSSTSPQATSGFGLAWDARRGRWISLVYRYVFPRSTFLRPLDFSTSTSGGLEGMKGRFEFGPCKQHHLTIGQSPFVRRQQQMEANRRRRKREDQHDRATRRRLSHISEERLDSFLSDDSMMYDTDQLEDLHCTRASQAPQDDKERRDEDEEDALMLNDFLSSAIIDHQYHNYSNSEATSGWNTNSIGGATCEGRLIAPSSPPPPLFLDGSCPIPDLDFLH